MNTKLISGIVIVALVAIGIVAFSFMNNDDPSTNQQPTQSSSDTSTKSSEAPKDATTITYKDFAVSPKTIQVKKGTTVTWVNEDTAKHDVTPVNETAEFKASALFGKGESHKVTFNTVGTYEFYCSPHPYMKSTVEVIE